VDEIVEWLGGVLGPDGVVESTRAVPREDSAFVTVTYGQRLREIEFHWLRAWREVDPRDQLASDVREALADKGELLFFPLGSYAEQCYMDRWNPKLE